MTTTRRRALGALLLAPALAAPVAARAEDAEVIDARVNVALEKLWREEPRARALAEKARAMLIMPEVLKGGLIFGGSYGEGALRLNYGENGYGPSIEYYSVAAASIGLQIGVQTTSHVLFFMTDRALEKFRRADGWELGADAEVTFPDAGANVGVDTTSIKKPIVAIVFGEDGLMVGASLEGAKYSRVYR